MSDFRRTLPRNFLRNIFTGVYQCFADNGISMASAWAVLKVIGDDVEGPGSVECWPTGPSSVLVRWAGLEGYVVIGYHVQITERG